MLTMLCGLADHCKDFSFQSEGTKSKGGKPFRNYSNSSRESGEMCSNPGYIILRYS